MCDSKTVHQSSMMSVFLCNSDMELAVGGVMVMTGLALAGLGTVSLRKHPLFSCYNTAISSGSMGLGGGLSLLGGFLVCRSVLSSRGAKSNESKAQQQQRVEQKVQQQLSDEGLWQELHAIEAQCEQAKAWLQGQTKLSLEEQLVKLVVDVYMPGKLDQLRHKLNQ